MVVNFSGVIVAAALLLAACGQEAAVIDSGNAGTRAVAAPLSAEASQAALCTSIASASSGGDASMQGALASDPDGVEYGGRVIGQIIAAGGYRFVRAGMVGDHCWAYARAAATVFNRAFDLRWRCPVLVVSDDRRQIGRTVLEEVDGAKCDFDAAPDMRTRREVRDPVERIAI